MAQVCRDKRVPFTEEELREISKGFQTLSSYHPNEKGGTVSVEQFAEVSKLVGYNSGLEEIQVYQNYWITNFGERLALDPFLNHMKSAHTVESLFPTLTQHMDKDGDAYISEREFSDIFKLLVTHDPSLQEHNVSFETFVQEADTSKDGKVSVEECFNWLKNKISPG